MAKNVVKLDERRLRNIIREAVRKVVEEERGDLWGSGVADYQGTGSEESKERVSRMRRIRPNMNPDTTHPGKAWWEKDEDGRHVAKFNDTTWANALKGFGGENAKGRMDAFKELVKPLYEKFMSMPRGSKAEAAFRELYLDMYGVYSEWASKHDGDDFGNE